MRYDLCGLSFDSDEPFPELADSATPESKPLLRLRREHPITSAGDPVRFAALWNLPDGRPFLISSKTENGYLLRFVELADFAINRSASEIVFSPRPEVPPDSIRHLFLDSVVPLALSLRGVAVLHASAIATPFGACAFAAETGTGKSTLAASFQQAGFASVTDDCLLLEMDGQHCYGRASYPGARLRADSLSMMQAPIEPTLSVAHYNSKRRVKTGHFTAGRHPMAAIYCLERPRGERLNQVQIEMLTGRERMVAALRYLFCLDPIEPRLLVHQFKLLERLLSRVPVLRLRIPDDFSALPQVHEAILSDVRGRNSSHASI